MVENHILPDDQVYVLVRSDGTFVVKGFDQTSPDLREAPRYSFREMKSVKLENRERWELIVPENEET